MRRKKKGPLTVEDIPGPRPLPVIGTRWIYSVGKYKLDKVHEAYKGNCCTYILHNICSLELGSIEFPHYSKFVKLFKSKTNV